MESNNYQWQQLANPANTAEANLLQPLFAAAGSDADWRQPLTVDSSGSLRLQAEQTAAMFPAVYVQYIRPNFIISTFKNY